MGRRLLLQRVMMRMGLFQQIFWRTIIMMAAVLMVLVGFSHTYGQHYQDGIWQDELRQQAMWTAANWNSAQAPTELARLWAQAHPSVRLLITDAQGKTTLDSRPEAGAIDASAQRYLIVAEAPIKFAGVMQTLRLAHVRFAVFPGSVNHQFLFWILLTVVLAAAAMYLLVRRLKRIFEHLADLARRVAGGHYGATLDADGPRDLAALIASFNDMSQQLALEERRRRRLLTDVSHELRSPMARLRALGETIGRHPQETLQHLARFDAEIALMDRIVGDLLQTARIEESDSALSVETVALTAWAQDAFDRVRHRVEEAGARCSSVIDPTSAAVRIDAQRMIQALGNLVDNAIVATTEREDREIRLALVATTAHWGIVVSDNGRGIPETDLPFVFDRFFRVEKDRNRATGGAGLGLSIVKAITQAHGGRVEITSTLDEGTRASILFGWSDEVQSDFE